MNSEREKLNGIVIIPEKSEQYLNPRQLQDYRSHREQLIKWLCNLGKDPEKAEGYAHDTARQRAYKIDRIYRWIWNQEGGYTLTVTTDHADAYSKELAYKETSKTHKAGLQKAIKTLFKYRKFEKGKTSIGNPKSSSPTAGQIRTRYGTS